jgi:hypothetical protein
MARHGRSFLFRVIVNNPFPRFATGTGANAAGATVALNTSLIAGAATGAASAPAATVSLNTSAIATAATGAASAAAATLTEVVSAVAGTATGAATRAGATVTLNASLIAGAATGGASAAGATVSGASSLISGGASGGGVGAAAGATITESVALSPGFTSGIPLGFPDASTTGVRAGVTLSAQEDGFTVTTNNAVISGRDIAGTLRIEANNVTVRDCRIAEISFYCVIIPAEYSGAVIEYCDITTALNGIAGSGTFRYNDISHVENGINVWGPSLIEHNYIHDLDRASDDPHYDGIELDGGGAATIRHNTVINSNTQTAALMLNNELGSVSGTIVDNNYLAGGGYTIYSDGRKSTDNPIENVSFTDNLLGSGIFGYFAVWDSVFVWTNNVDVATWRYVDSGFGNPLGAAAPLATGAAVAAGATITETASLLAGAASAGGAGTASGVTVSLAASLLAGTATGAAARAGVTVTEATSLLAGSASAAITAPGATVTAATSFIAGAKSGAAVASGATVAESASLFAGAAFGPGALPAVAPPVRASFDQTGAFWDSTTTTFDAESTRVLPVARVSLIAGAAVGGIGAVPGVTLTAAFTLIPGSAASTTEAVPGKTLTAAHSFIAGAAAGNTASSAAGATITTVTALVAGAAIGSGGTQAAVAPPPRRTFDRTNVRWDLTSVTFDEESSGVLPQASYILVPGAAVVGNGAQGAILSSTVSLIAGAAIGSTAPIAAGATVVTVATFIAGGVNSSQPAMVAGTTFTLAATLIAGAATGAVATAGAISWDATSPTWDTTSVTFDQTTGGGAGTGAGHFIGQPTYTFIPGTAAGMVVAAGVTFETRASFMASPANVQTGPGTAQGATVTAVVSLEPGRARGQGWTKPPNGGGLPWTNVGKPGSGWTRVPGPGGKWDKVA